MSLGILNNISAIYAQNNLSSTQNSLSKTLQQLSSGSRINSGADDAAGLAVADGLAANATALAQSARNAGDGIGLLQTADGALSQVTSLLNRAVTLATQSSNGTLSQGQVSSADQEYQNILKQINVIGTSTNFNGSAVFTGTAKNFFVSDGTSSGSVTYGDIVGVLTTGSIGTTTSLAPATATTTFTAASASSAASAPTAGSPASSVAVTGSTPTASAAGTASTSTITMGGTTHSISGNLSVAVGAGAAHSITVAAGTTLTNLAAQINADTTYAANGVTATVNASTGVLTLSGPATATSNLSLTGSTLQDTTPAVAATTGAAVASSTTLTLGGTDHTVGGTLSLAVGSGTAHTITVASGTKLSSLADQINADSTYAAANITASYDATSGAIKISGPAAAASNIATTGSTLTDTNAVKLGAGVDFTNAQISTLTADTAPKVLTSLTAAISDVAYQRGTIGANINQLSSAQSVALSAQTNLTAAENNIRATDYGQAASNLSKFQVLSQAGISALAQANSVQQEVLKLLQ